MNKTLKLVLSVAVVIATGVSGYFYGKSQQVSLGSNPGPDYYNSQTFHAGLTRNNVNSTSTTLATYTMVAGDLVKNGAFVDTYIHFKTGAVATTTNTLPATSTLAHVLPYAGMRTDICFVVATSTGGAGLVLSEGTGWKFAVASSTHTVSSNQSPTSGPSRTIQGGQPTCGYIIRERVFNDSAGFVETATSTAPGDLVLILVPSVPAQ